MRPVLIVDDDPVMRDALREAITKIGYESVVASDGVEAVDKIGNHEFSAVVTDMNMPRVNGLELIQKLRQSVADLPVLVITGYGTIENAVDCMKEGACDYIMKPFSFEKLRRSLEKIIAPEHEPDTIITTDRKMKDLIRIASDIARTDTTVLITGESGTGKELFARYIHKKSDRREGPFVAVNCAAIPENLLESEMFGHEKGSFSGATERKTGKFELADRGTILLDEIGEMPVSLQAKLLRVLQEKEVDRIGGRSPVKIDIRVIATTNRDLRREIMEGRFREDLYYRLSVFPIEIPPLRERNNDVKLLAGHFVRLFASRARKDIAGIDEKAMDMLLSHGWRGNVRELENVMHRAVVLCKGKKISSADIVLDGSGETFVDAGTGSLKEMERKMILKVLKETGGNRTLAAKRLGITVRTLRNKLNEYGENSS